jgi:DNA-binding PadR family transcriptional regulator
MELRPASYFVLASLLEGPLHGYAISARARELSDGEVRLTAGTLYGSLDRMAATGLLEIDREETVEGRLRRYYRITDEGRDRVVREADRLAAAAGVVRRMAPPKAARGLA